jgi:hypothetical protein
MDPFKQIHEDLHDFVFQHLTTNELLNISEVSRYWYDAIGSSSVFSSNIWVNVDDRFAEPCKEIIEIFKNSHRNYDNFKIFEVGNGLKIILNNKRKWKRVQIGIQSFMQMIQYYELLKIIPHIIHLEIFEIDIQECLQESQALQNMRKLTNEKFSFPNLLKLYFGFMSINAIEPFIDSCPKLKTIIFDEVNFKEIQYEKQTIIAFFKSQYILENLQVPVKVLNIIFENLNEMNFSLKKFFIDFSDEEQLHEEKLKSFLLKQNLITWIKINDCCQPMIVTKFLKFCKSLKRLSIEYFDSSSVKFETHHLKEVINNSVEQIDLECENLTLVWITPILKSLIALKSIYVFHLNEEQLNYIVKNNKNIQNILCCSVYKTFKNLPEFAQIQLIEEKSFLEACKL